MPLFKGEACCNAVIKTTLKYHQPDTRYNRIKTKKFKTIPFRKNHAPAAVVALGMCKVCKYTGAPPLLGPPPPFDLSRAEKFDYEKLYQIMMKSLCICFKCHYICTPSLKIHLFQVLLHISAFPRQYYFQFLSQI